MNIQNLFRPDSLPRIRNPHRSTHRSDFGFNLFSFLVMFTLSTVLALVFQFAGGGLAAALFIRGTGAVLVAASIYALFGSWTALLAALITAMAVIFAATGLRGDWAILAWEMQGSAMLYVSLLFFIILMGPSIQVVNHWDKAVVLRFGRFHRVKGPGIFILLPVIDRMAAVVDTRIRVTDFSAEKILTRDTVPVHVDALAFWMIWDAQKAILEVEDFLEAVTLSAQTALRDSVGKYTLTTLLSERETLYREIQTILDAKTNPWGITILSVEFVDIQLPKDLEDVMSRTAQAEREKSARLLQGEAEAEVAQKYLEASAIYKDNPQALNLRSMAMVYDAMKTRGSMVVLPSSALDGMNMGTQIAAAQAVNESMHGRTPVTGKIDTKTETGDASSATGEAE